MCTARVEVEDRNEHVHGRCMMVEVVWAGWQIYNVSMRAEDVVLMLIVRRG